MYMIEKVAKTEFPKNVTHKPLKLNPSKNPRLPTPRVEQALGHEEEIFEEGAARPDQPQAGTQTVTGMCRSQHYIQVEQQRSRRANKQMRDTMKLMHNAQGFQPPRSPQVEIPSFEERMRGWANSDMLNQYGPMFL
jgi:hypothetical protein